MSDDDDVLELANGELSLTADDMVRAIRAHLKDHRCVVGNIEIAVSAAKSADGQMPKVQIASCLGDEEVAQAVKDCAAKLHNVHPYGFEVQTEGDSFKRVIAKFFRAQ